MNLPPVIGILGAKEAGKDAVAAILSSKFGYKRRAFADPLKDEVACALNHGFSSPEGVIPPPDIKDTLSVFAGAGSLAYDKPTIPSIRRLLQWWGTEYRRSIDPSYWTRALVPADLTVIPDVRFENEMDFVRDCGGQLWRVVRPGKSGDKHVSEELARTAVGMDVEIVNNGTLEDLEQKVVRIFTPRKSRKEAA